MVMSTVNAFISANSSKDLVVLKDIIKEAALYSEKVENDVLLSCLENNLNSFSRLILLDFIKTQKYLFSAEQYVLLLKSAVIEVSLFAAQSLLLNHVHNFIKSLPDHESRKITGTVIDMIDQPFYLKNPRQEILRVELQEMLIQLLGKYFDIICKNPDYESCLVPKVKKILFEGILSTEMQGNLLIFLMKGTDIITKKEEILEYIGKLNLSEKFFKICDFTDYEDCLDAALTGSTLAKIGALKVIQNKKMQIFYEKVNNMLRNAENEGIFFFIVRTLAAIEP
jgi:hypothetical protein